MICKTLCQQTNCLRLLAATLAALWGISSASAVPVAVTNPGFELPSTVKTEYWDSSGNIVPGIIPGWEPSGPGLESPGGPAGGPGDSGVEPDATFGAWAGYLSALDPSIYNTTSTALAAGNRVTLTFALNDAFTSDTNYTQILNQAFLKADLYYLDGANRISMGSTTIGPFGFGYADHTLIVPSVPAVAAGKLLGVEFDNVSDLLGSDPVLGPVVHSWIHLDNVRLDVVIPEPATFTILLLTGAAIVGFARRR